MNSQRRLIALAIIILIPVMAVLVRSMWLVALPPPMTEIEQKQEDARKTQVTKLSSPRGGIFDSHGTPMAVSNRALRISLNPAVVSTTETIISATNFIATAVAYPDAEIQQRIELIVRDSKVHTPTKRTVTNIVLDNIQPQAMKYFSDTVKNAKVGVSTDWTWKRDYPLGPIAGPTLGFISGEPVGYSGVEGYYEQQLQSRVGERWQEGPENLIVVTPTMAGSRLVLSLDTELQSFVEQQLSKGVKDYGAQGGTIIVMETHTGAILASASWPGFDPNKAIELANTKGPMSLVDPAVSMAYEPGSVYKLLTIASALDAGTITNTSKFNDSGTFVVDGRTIRNSDRRGHGVVDLVMTLQESLNVVAAQISTLMGPNLFYQHLGRFGIGSLTGVDLMSEARGTLRTPATDDQWSKVDLATNSFGQGLACTPLQVINAINAIANDGVLMQPYVVKQWVSEDGAVVNRRPTAIGPAVSPETARTVRKMAMIATRNATPDLHLNGYTIAGKTGTAQWYLRGILQDSTIVSYVGWLPANQPRLTILVKFDQPKSSQWAADTTVPVFMKVAEKAASLMNIPPDVMREDR